MFLSRFAASALAFVLIFLNGALSFRAFGRGARTSFSKVWSTVIPRDNSGLTVEVKYDGIAVSGFVDKGKNFADPFVFSTLFHSGRWASITTVTDDVAFARKRLVNPNTVYSGLVDVIKYASVTDQGDWCKALEGNEAWMAYGLSSSDLPALAEIAVKQKMKRVVFAVKVEESEIGAGVVFDSVCQTLSSGGVAYTIFKYGDTRKVGEAKFPFRIVRGVLPMPTEGQCLSSDDLMRIMVESMDIPKTFNAVYGVGPGTVVDAEILVYMKSQGWPERVQVGLLVGDMMEKLEVKFAEEQKNRDEKEAGNVKPKGLPNSGGSDGNKLAGFFK